MSGSAVRFDPRISAAIRERSLSTLQELISAQPEQISAYTPFAGGTWLHYAAREGDMEGVRLLLAQGSDVNTGDAREGRVAICDAALGGHEVIVQLLLEAGSKLDTTEPVRNPLFSAIVGRNLPVVRLLLDQGIDASVAYHGQSMRGMDAIAFALERGETIIAEEIAAVRAKGDRRAAATLLEHAHQVARSNNAG